MFADFAFGAVGLAAEGRRNLELARGSVVQSVVAWSLKLWEWGSILMTCLSLLMRAQGHLLFFWSFGFPIVDFQPSGLRA